MLSTDHASLLIVIRVNNQKNLQIFTKNVSRARKTVILDSYDIVSKAYRYARYLHNIDRYHIGSKKRISPTPNYYCTDEGHHFSSH